MWITWVGRDTMGVLLMARPGRSSSWETLCRSILWQRCVDVLRDELPSQQFNTWIRPLQVEAEGDELRVVRAQSLRARLGQRKY